MALVALLVIGGIYGFAFGYGYGSRKSIETAEAMTWWEEGPEQTFEGTITGFVRVPEDVQKENAGQYTAVHKSGETEEFWDWGPMGNTYCLVQNDKGRLGLVGPADERGNEWVSVDEDWANPGLVVGAKVRVTYYELNEAILVNSKKVQSGPMRKVRWVMKMEVIK